MCRRNTPPYRQRILDAAREGHQRGPARRAAMTAMIVGVHRDPAPRERVHRRSVAAGVFAKPVQQQDRGARLRGNARIGP